MSTSFVQSAAGFTGYLLTGRVHVHYDPDAAPQGKSETMTNVGSECYELLPCLT